MNFVHLHVHDCYSLLDGLGTPKKFLTSAKEMGQPALAETNHGTCGGFFDFYKEATKQGVKPILGVEIYVVDNYKVKEKQKMYHLVLLAKNAEGVKNLYRIVTEANINGFYYKPRIGIEYVLDHCQDVIALSACASSYVSKPSLEGDTAETYRRCEVLQHHFKENFFLELMPHDFKEQKTANLINLELSRKYGVKLVATNDAHYSSAKNQKAHDVLLLVQSDSTLTNKKFVFEAKGLYLKSRDEMFQSFRTSHEYITEHEVNSALDNTILVADMINIKLDYSKPIFPRFEIPAEYTTNYDYIKALLKQGLVTRGIKTLQNTDAVKWGNYITRLEYELSVIKDKGFIDYFLIVRDFIVWAKNNNIIVGPARGSAAGSLISYLLNISQLDPLEYDLLFERFLNPIRIKTPDIDTDFEADRREEVKQYIIGKYGQDKVASLGAFTFMSCNFAYRDVARVYELDSAYANGIAKQMESYKVKGSKEYMTLEENIANIAGVAAEYNRNPTNKEVFDIACQLQLQPRHTTVTAGGLLITDKPITDYVSLRNAKGVMITEWDKYMVEEAKFLKIDVLGLKTLSVFKECLGQIGKSVDWLFNLKLDDPKVYKLFRDGLTDGIFQFESDGIKELLKKMKPTCFNDIVVANALYRPGTMKEIDSYIARKNGAEQISYVFPGIENIVKDTYGKVVFQEQVMLMLAKATGLSLAEADILRKYLEGKDDEGKEKYIKQIRITNKDNPLLEQIVDYIKNFGGYLFNKSHSCAYSVLAYYTAYLKVYHQKEFFTALLNQYIDDKTTMSQYFNEVKRILNLNPVDINKCKARFTFDDSGLNVGLISLKGVGEKAAMAIEQNAPYESVADFMYKINRSTAVNKRVVEILVKIGAFDSLQVRDSVLKQFQFGTYDYMQFESEILGYNRVHKLDAYWARGEHDFKRLSAISTMQPKEGGKFLGEITEVVVRKDKNSNSYAIVTFYDGQSNGRGIVWSSSFKTIEPLIKKGKVVAFSGSKSETDNSIFISRDMSEVPL